MCRLCPPIAKSSPHLTEQQSLTGTAQRSAERPDGGIGRRAGLKHQWSNPCRFDPGSGYFNRKSLIFKDLRFFFWILQDDCTAGWTIRTGFFKSSVKTCLFTDGTVNFRVSSVKIWDFTDGHALCWTIECIFIGKLLSIPPFFGVSRAVSLCFCTRLIVT